MVTSTIRARYYKPDIGRFWTMDAHEGNNEGPQSLHLYLYCRSNPVQRKDPSGHDGELFSALTVMTGVASFSQATASLGKRPDLSGTLAMIITDPARPIKTGGGAYQRAEYYVFGFQNGWILQHIKLDVNVTDRDGNSLQPNNRTFDVTEAIEVRGGVVYMSGAAGRGDQWATLPEDESKQPPYEKFRDCKGTVKLTGRVKFVAAYKVALPPWNQPGRGPGFYTTFPWMNGTPADWNDAGAQDRILETQFDTYSGTATSRGVPR
jgi:hypothetical protein